MIQFLLASHPHTFQPTSYHWVPGQKINNHLATVSSSLEYQMPDSITQLISNNTFLLTVKLQMSRIVQSLLIENAKYTIPSMFTTQYQLCHTKCRIHPPKYQTLFNNVFCCFLRIYEINIILVTSRPQNTNKLAKNLKLCSEKMWVQFTPSQLKVLIKSYTL